MFGVPLKHKKYQILLKALQAFDKTIELNPDDTEAWGNKGIALEILGQYEEALKAYDKTIELSPDDAGVWHNKGVTLGALGRHEEALKAFDKAIELKLDDATIWYNKGVTLGTLNRHEEALQAFDKAIELKPDYADARHNKGIALDELGRNEESLKAYDEAIELKPDDADAWHNRALIRSLKNKENPQAINIVSNTKQEATQNISDKTVQQYVAAEIEKINNKAALTGFILGLVSILFAWIGIIPLCAIIFSVVGACTFKPETQKNKWQAIVGLVLGILGMLSNMSIHGHFG